MAALRSLSHLYEVVGIAEPIAGRQAIAEKQKAYAGLNWLTEEALLSDPSVQAIAVETTLADSARAALACLRAGKHLHLDKPGAASHAEFKALRTRSRSPAVDGADGLHAALQSCVRTALSRPP
jgi:predicted dehydrogenase